jgi:uncharacterized protein YlxP (DUF503 family)
MKNTDDLKKEVAENIKLMKQKKDAGLKYKSISKKNEELTSVIRYLESNPKEEYLKAEKEKIQKIIDSKKSQFNYWAENVCSQDVFQTKRRALFNKEVGITDLSKRLKTLNYILS